MRAIAEWAAMGGYAAFVWPAYGIAMGNAIPEARAASHRHTLCNEKDGVAHAIEKILSGDW